MTGRAPTGRLRDQTPAGAAPPLKHLKCGSGRHGARRSFSSGRLNVPGRCGLSPVSVESQFAVTAAALNLRVSAECAAGTLSDSDQY